MSVGRPRAETEVPLPRSGLVLVAWGASWPGATPGASVFHADT